MTNGPEEFTIGNVIEQTTMKGKRTRLACPKRAGGWCEPAEARAGNGAPEAAVCGEAGWYRVLSRP